MRKVLSFALQRLMKIEIDSSLAGKTVKEVVKKLNISTRLLTRLKAMEDGICVNSKRETVRYVLRENDLLTLKLEDTRCSENIKPYDAPIDVLWEDEWYVALAKPANLPTHPARHHQGDTLASRAAHLYRGTSFIFRALTRLDLDTSGVVIIAKNQLAANEFSKLLISRSVKKEYLAVCLGKISESGSIDYRISRPDPKSIIRVAGKVGEEALTEYSVIKATDEASLVSLSLITGRTHQIRVHMKAIGHPVLGDTLYSIPSPHIARQALHARSVVFTHPFTSEQISVTCPLFEDMELCIKKLFGELT